MGMAGGVLRGGCAAGGARRAGCWLGVVWAALPLPSPAQTGSAGAEGEAPPAPAYSCALEARFDRLEESHYLPVKVATGLPDAAVLFLGAYYLKPASALFIRPDRPPPPPDEVLLDSTTVVVREGRCEARLWITRRVPYPGTYRIRGAVHWPDQPAFFRGENPDERAPLEWTLDLARGTPEDVAAERETIRAAVKADIDRLRSLQRDLAGRFRDSLKGGAGGGGWEAWLASWREPLGPLTSRNAERLEVGVFWSETQGKYRVQDLTERVEALAGVCTEALRQEPPTSVPPEIELQEVHFLAIYEGALNLLGFLKPVDPALVREHLGPIAADLERVAAAAAALRAATPGVSAAEVESLRGEVLDRLQGGFGVLLPAAPEQAVEPATGYTEAVTELFGAAAGVARGDKAAEPALAKALEAAQGHLKRLQNMIAQE